MLVVCGLDALLNATFGGELVLELGNVDDFLYRELCQDDFSSFQRCFSDLFLLQDALSYSKLAWHHTLEKPSHPHVVGLTFLEVVGNGVNCRQGIAIEGEAVEVAFGSRPRGRRGRE